MPRRLFSIDREAVRVQSPFMGIAPRLNALDIYSSNEAYQVSSDILYGHLLFIGVFYDW